MLLSRVRKKGIDFKRQVHLPVYYDEYIFDEGLKLDVLVEDKIICELKALDIVNALWQAQILSHLKLTGNHVGFLINFNSTLIRDGIRRFSVL